MITASTAPRELAGYHLPIATPPTARWHVVSITQRSDAHAVEWLTRAGFETYYPQLRDMRPVPLRKRSPRQRKAVFTPMEPVVIPLFPRYVFVRFDPAQPGWQAAFARAGAAGLLCHGGQPAAIADADLARFRDAEIDGAVPGGIPTRFVVPVGAQVRIIDGVFSGIEAKVQRGIDIPLGELDDGARIVVLANLFGGAAPVEVEIGQVIVAQSGGRR